MVPRVAKTLFPDPSDPRLTQAVTGTDERGARVDTAVVVERGLTLYLNAQEIVTMMTIGDYPEYLALGFLLNQNMLQPDDIVTGVDFDEELDVVVVRTERETDYEEKLKKRVQTSGCAQGTTFGDLMEALETTKLPEALLKTSWLYALTQAINTMPSLYLEAGAIHGCVLARESEPLVEAGGAFGEPGKATIRVSFDPEIMKVIIDKMCREAGVAIQYHTKVTDVLRANGKVTGVKANYGEELLADVVIDASGDGHVAWLAGARYEQGEAGDPTYVQPITLYFLMGGVDLEKTIAYACSGREDFSEGYLRKLRILYEGKKPLTIPGFPRLREAAAQNGDYPTAFGSTTLNPRAHNNILRPIFRNGQVVYDTTMHNVDMAYRVDATDNKTLSEAIGSMRDFTLRIGEFYRKYVPGYENSYILQIADSVGVRETRRVVGEYMLTGEDVLEAREFPDSIGYCGATVDVHNIDGSDTTRMTAIRGGRLYQIPYRILVPEQTDGLLVAGRCVSADRVACGSIRQQAGCIVTGQAAGIAAALAGEQRVEARNVPIGAIQQALRAQGAQI